MDLNNYVEDKQRELSLNIKIAF